MKKLFLVGALALFGAMNAQRVQKGESQINAGVGFSSDWGTPVYVGFDHGVHKDVTVGAEASFASHKYDGNVKGKWFGIGANANYHFNSVFKIPNNWDLYAGVTLAYNSFSYDNSAFNGEASGVGFSGQIGGRYYFNDKFGVNVEFGGGTVASGGKAGISYKF